MRTVGRTRCYVRVLLRSPRLVGISVIAILVGLSRLGGESWTSAIDQLVISPAEARKARTALEPKLRPTADVFDAPAFGLPLIAGPSVGPSAALRPSRLEPAMPAKVAPPKPRVTGLQPAKKARGRGLADTAKLPAREPAVGADAL